MAHGQACSEKGASDVKESTIECNARKGTSSGRFYLLLGTKGTETEAAGAIHTTRHTAWIQLGTRYN